MIRERPRAAPTAAALRMRRSRERRQQGEVIATLEVGPQVTTALAALGWLAAPDGGYKDALSHALSALIVRAIETRVTPLTGPEGKVSFLCDIHPSTIET